MTAAASQQNTSDAKTQYHKLLDLYIIRADFQCAFELHVSRKLFLFPASEIKRIGEHNCGTTHHSLIHNRLFKVWRWSSFQICLIHLPLTIILSDFMLMPNRITKWCCCFCRCPRREHTGSTTSCSKMRIADQQQIGQVMTRIILIQVLTAFWGQNTYILEIIVFCSFH